MDNFTSNFKINQCSIIFNVNKLVSGYEPLDGWFDPENDEMVSGHSHIVGDNSTLCLWTVNVRKLLRLIPSLWIVKPLRIFISNFSITTISVIDQLFKGHTHREKRKLEYILLFGGKSIMSMSDSDTSSQGSDYKNFRQVIRDSKYSIITFLLGIGLWLKLLGY